MKSKQTILGGVILAVIMTSTEIRAEDKPAAAAPAKPSTESKINDLFPDEVVARGKGIEVKRSRLDEAISGFRANAAARGVELTPRDLPFLEKNAFDHLVDVQLIDAQATAANKAKASAEADKQIESLKKQAPSLEAFERQLKAINMTSADLHARLLDEAIMSEVLRGKINVTDEQVKKYYTDNPTRFQEPERVKINHILLLTTDVNGLPVSVEEKKAKLKKAEDIQKRAKTEDFVKLAEEFSEDPKVKENHGEIIFARDTGRVPKEFEAAAFSLAPGLVSDVVISQVGYHIIKSSEKIPSKKIEFDTVKSDLRNYLEQVEMNTILPSVAEKLRKDADIQIVDDQLKNTLKIAEETAKSIKQMNADTNHVAIPVREEKVSDK